MHTQSPLSQAPSPGLVKWKRPLSLGFTILGVGILGIVCTLVASMAQTFELSRMALIMILISGWVIYSLVFGFSFGAFLIWSALFFFKPFEISFYALLFSMVFYLILEFYSNNRPKFIIPYPLPLLVLFIAALQGLLRAWSFADAANYFTSTGVVPAIALIYFANARWKTEDYDHWLKAIVIVAAIVGFIGVILGILNPNERIGSLWVTAMTINGFYTIAFFFSIALTIHAERLFLKVFWGILALLIILGILYTYTRIALLAVMFGVGIITLRIKKFRLFGMFLLLLVPLAIPASMLIRLKSGLNQDASMYIRFVAWWYSLGVIKDNPLFGMGISVWKEWYKGIAPMRFLYAEHPHNIFLKILVEIGLVGFVPYFYLIGNIILQFYRKCVRNEKGYYNFLVMLGALSLLFSCITDIFIQQYSISIIFWFCLAFMHIKTKAADSILQPAANHNEG